MQAHQHHQQHIHVHTDTNVELKAKNLHRIKIIQGHLKAIQNMIENDQYCVDVIHQSMAVQRAMKKLDMEIMQNHLETCVIDQIANGEHKRAVAELLKLYEMK